jgi:hypothetical protein
MHHIAIDSDKTKERGFHGRSDYHHCSGTTILLIRQCLSRYRAGDNPFTVDFCDSVAPNRREGNQKRPATHCFHAERLSSISPQNRHLIAAARIFSAQNAHCFVGSGARAGDSVAVPAPGVSTTLDWQCGHTFASVDIPFAQLILRSECVCEWPKCINCLICVPYLTCLTR